MMTEYPSSEEALIIYHSPLLLLPLGSGGSQKSQETFKLTVLPSIKLRPTNRRWLETVLKLPMRQPHLGSLQTTSSLPETWDCHCNRESSEE
jgi:hypothetical protein